MQHSPFTGFKRLPLAIALLGACALQPIAVAQAVEVETTEANTQRFNFNIAAQSLGDALEQFASQSGSQVLYDAQQTKGLRSAELHGQLTAQEALVTLTRGTQAVYTQPNASSFVIDIPASSTSSTLQLSAVSISGKAPGSTTEGTGLYTTYSSSSSTRLNLTQKETPQTLTVMTRQRMDDQRLTNLTDVLEATPGISVSRVGVGAENDTYWSRGFQINNFEIDGIPTSPRLANFSQSMAMYDRVEVVRGATGLISGSGTPSATINMIRKRPTAEAQASVTGEAGSWDRYGVGMDVSGPLTDNGNVRGRLVLDYKNQHAWVDRYTQENQLIYGITEFDLSEATLLSVGFSYLKSNANSPLRTGFQTRFSNGEKTSFSRSANSAPDWSYYDQARSNLFTSLEHQFDNGWSAKVEIGHTEYKFDELINYMNGELDQATGGGAYMFPNRWSGTPRENNLDAFVTGPFSLFGREHELITGVTLSRYRESVPLRDGWYGPWTGYDGTIDNIYTWNGKGNRPDTATVGKSVIEENQYAAYMTTRLHVTDNTTLILGGRVTDWQRSSETDGYDGSHSENSETRNGLFLPYTGVVYDLNDTWSLYANYTKIFNPQAYGVKGVDQKPLDPQEGKGYEIGVKGSFYDDKLNASLALFKIEQDNLPVFTGVFDTYTAAQGTTTKGLELEFNGELAEGWQASSGYAYSVSTDEDDKRIATNVPRHSLKTFTTYRLPGAWDKLTIGGGVNWQSKIGINLHESEQGSYTLTNLMARYQVSKNLSATVNLNNVFDRTYYAYADNWSVYGAPRNLMTGFKYDF